MPFGTPMMQTFPASLLKGLQRSLDVISETYLRAGITISTKKTVSLCASSPDVPTTSICGNQLKDSEIFT